MKNCLILLSAFLFIVSCSQNSDSEVNNNDYIQTSVNENITNNNSYENLKKMVRDDMENYKACFSNPDSVKELQIMHEFNGNAFPDSVLLFKNLENLTIAFGDSLSESDFKTISHFRKLKRLQLHNLTMLNGCSGLRYVSRVEELILESVVFIPKETGKLKNLKTLIIYGNPVYGSPEYIPARIFDLKNLETLEIHDAPDLKDIPADIEKLVHLEKLYLTKCGIKIIPPEIGKLTNLQVLTINGQKLISEIPLEIGQLKNLKTLDLWRNRIFSFPDELKKLTNLKYFVIANNSFGEDEIDKIKTLLPGCEIILQHDKTIRENIYETD